MRMLEFIGGILVAGVLAIGTFKTVIWLLSKPIKSTDGDSK